MRLPAVAIAAAFACGILLGLHPAVGRNAASPLLLSWSFAAIAVLVLTGIFFVGIGRLFLASAVSLACPSAANATASVQAEAPNQQQDEEKK